jgi:hypothetical protein
LSQLQPLGFADRRIVSFDDRDVAPEQTPYRRHDQIFSQVHRERKRLQNKMIAVPIDNHAWQTVALAPDNTTQRWIDVSTIAILGSLLNSPPEEIVIKILPPPREPARDNLRFRIVNRAADQVIFPILKGDNVAVGRISKNFKHFTRKHPVMSVQNARAWFNNDSGHEKEPTSNAERSTSNAQVN